MDATAPSGPRERERTTAREAKRSVAQRSEKGTKPSLLSRIGVDARGVMAWWTKVNNDWVFNLAGMLAYNFLMSVFPILLVILAVVGFIIGNLAPSQQASFEASLNSALPGGHTIVAAVTKQLSRSAGILLIVGIVTAAYAGSRLFIVLENCFGIIFRLRSRNFIRQNIMALGMLCLYMVLIPLIVLGSIIPSTINHALGAAARNPAGAFFIQLIGILISVLFAFILLGAIYVVVPNRPVRVREVWKGTLVGAALLVIYNLVFPFYESKFLHPDNYGSVAGFAVVILVFFYYLGFLILIGAEVNSWATGQRETSGDITAILHEVQAHDTTRGAAGPTAGLPQEDLQHHEGAAAMRDDEHAVKHEREGHHVDVQPPKPAEAHLPGPPHRTKEEREQKWNEAARATGVEKGDGKGKGDGKADGKSHAGDDGDDSYDSHDGHDGAGHAIGAARGDEAAPSGQQSRELTPAGEPRMRASADAGDMTGTGSGTSTGQRTARPLTPRPPLGEQGRQALTAVAITAGAVIAPVVAWLLRRDSAHDDGDRRTAMGA